MNNQQQVVYNYMSAADLNTLIQAAEERGREQGYKEAKREEEKPINAKEAAKYLGVHLSTIKRWTSERTIPHHKKGGNTYYYKHELKP